MATQSVGAKAQQLNLTIEKGATFLLNLTWKRKDSATDALSPVDLSGYTARMQIRERKASANTVLELLSTNSFPDPQIFLNGESGSDTGVITLKIPDSVTTGIAIKRGYYDLELIDGSGNVRRLIEGAVSFDAEVTR